VRARRLIGLPVLSTSGRRLGRVEDVLLAMDACKLSAVLCRSPRWRPPLYLPPAAWLACTETRLVADETLALPTPPAQVRPWRQVAGACLRSTDGMEIGWLCDAELTPDGGVTGWLVSQGAFHDILQGLRRLPPRPLQGESDLVWPGDEGGKSPT
jgi:uncharacterized protein YrrD